jgi:hypothetical protein
MVVRYARVFDPPHLILVVTRARGRLPHMPESTSTTSDFQPNRLMLDGLPMRKLIGPSGEHTLAIDGSALPYLVEELAAFSAVTALWTIIQRGKSGLLRASKIFDWLGCEAER